MQKIPKMGKLLGLMVGIMGLLNPECYFLINCQNKCCKRSQLGIMVGIMGLIEHSLSRLG